MEVKIKKKQVFEIKQKCMNFNVMMSNKMEMRDWGKTIAVTQKNHKDKTRRCFS